MAVHTTLAPTPHEHRDSNEQQKPRWSKKVIAAIAAGAIGLAAGAVALTRGGENDPSPEAPVAAGNKTPGVEATDEETVPKPSISPSDLPSVAPTEQLSPLDQQKKLYESVTIPGTVINYDYLNEHADASVFEIYDQSDLAEVRRPFSQIEPADIATNLAAGDRIFEGTYTDIVDGKPVKKTANEFFQNGLGLPLTREALENVKKEAKANGKSESTVFAATLVSAALYSVTEGVQQALEAEQRVASYNEKNTEKPAEPSTVSALGVGEFGFVRHGAVPVDTVYSHVAEIRSVAIGESASVEIDYDTAKIIEVAETKMQSADKKVTASYLGAIILWNTKSDPTPRLISVVFEQPDKILVASADGTADLIDGKDTFYVRTVAQTTPSLANS